ncbi:dihydrouridine synthase (dus) protein [Toxoplasma gondii ME49]|uniref:Dihydrouridine synthase (Dus) protein n=4 Tax=Toxoplasma gondii TaxID=5811 RepID=S7UTR6_TOXGG|nr:dihydrouridine synthase (dus) protein [Toxoplasma gondii ME49]EPR61321.1 dihydrouridine synthase (dus) protein [Toxoplasma gondii GT1]EPT29826.1 dihydrouridine synthase (dus) protein [Toxoplasma gondii ME49]KAF4642537.1 dihydrouridine synthase (dus) protein [Toxoplasma gondii]KFG36367.1 dihydrouridine synthase (dus) protein [Toxoplasma gondii FOU]|eukprot:XP_002371472.1 dihydrouridine synthase (dus) protein [Toxoplasma gondii ME49]
MPGIAEGEQPLQETARNWDEACGHCLPRQLDTVEENLNSRKRRKIDGDRMCDADSEGTGLAPVSSRQPECVDEKEDGDDSEERKVLGRMPRTTVERPSALSPSRGSSEDSASAAPLFSCLSPDCAASSLPASAPASSSASASSSMSETSSPASPPSSSSDSLLSRTHVCASSDLSLPSRSFLSTSSSVAAGSVSDALPARLAPPLSSCPSGSSSCLSSASSTGCRSSASDSVKLLEAEDSLHFKPRGLADRYCGKWILAPMVRIGILPFRLECLKYGADLVYTEETIDHKLLNSVRTFNEDFSTIDFLHKSEKTCVFSTCLEERGKVVMQLGTSDATRALKAAMLVAQDVAAVDVNMGCPKSFSINGGMGAALLKTPLIATDILKTLRRNLDIPVTCKIRLLDTIHKTIDFARLCENCGIEAIAIHARETHERPSHRAHWDLFPALKSSLAIPLIANGDFLTRRDADVFQEKIGADSLMFARGAMWDPSIFSWKKGTTKNVVAEFDSDSSAALSCEKETPSLYTSDPPPMGQNTDFSHPGSSLPSSESSRVKVMRGYIKRAVVCGAPYQAIKFCLQSMAAQCSSDRNVNLAITSSKSTRDLCRALDLDLFYETVFPKLPPHANTLNYHKMRNLPEAASTQRLDSPLAFSSYLS